MSYVPDYVRRVSPRKTPTASSSATNSVTSSGSSTPTKSATKSPLLMTDGQFFTRNQRRTSVPASHTSNYARPQNRVCARQSIKDRVKNLEADAAVKLEVRYHSTENYRRRSGLRYNGSTPGTPIKTQSSMESNVSNEGLQLATPDIIRAHIKPKASRQLSNPVCLEHEIGNINDANEKSNEDIIPKVAPEKLSSPEIEFDFGTDVEDNKTKEENVKNEKPVPQPRVAHAKPPVPEKTEELKARKNNAKIIGAVSAENDGSSGKINAALNCNKVKEQKPILTKKESLRKSRNNSLGNEKSALTTKPESTQSSRASSRKSSTSGTPSADNKERTLKVDDIAIASSTTSPSLRLKWNKVKPEHTPVVSHPKLQYKMSEPLKRHKNFVSSSKTTESSLHKAASYPKLSLSAESSTEDIPIKVQSDKTSLPVRRSFSLLWKAPSKEALSRLHGQTTEPTTNSLQHVDVDKVRVRSQSSDPVVDVHELEQKPQHKIERKRSISADTSLNQSKPEEVELPKHFIRRKNQKKPQEERTTENEQVVKNVASPKIRQKVVQRRKVPDMLIFDVKTANETVPVELRSPRHDNHSSVTSRQAAKDKRNACVFLMPSSDSENDQLFANFVTQQQNADMTDSVNSAHVPPVKFVPSLLQRNYAKSISSSGTETSPKTQPKHNGEGRLGNTTTMNEDKDGVVHRRRHARSMKRGNSNRSKSSDARPMVDSKNRSRHHQRSSSFRSRRWDGPSPRQQAVASMVKYGNNGKEQIPFIDDHHQDRYDSSTTSDSTTQNNGVIGRSNSADSILAFPVSEPTRVNTVVKRRPRAKSVDRNTARGVHRRSYQMATTPQIQASNSKENDSTPKRQQSIHKLKNFFGENTPTLTDATADEARKRQPLNREASRYIDLAEQEQARGGFLNFKVATIEKGKRSSSQKSWKVVWAVLIDNELFLCKDWSRNKPSHEILNCSTPTILQLEEDTLDVNNSLVGIAYNYLKKRNVFKLTTVNGSEYLFQAEDSDDMLAWIKVLQESAHKHHKINEDLILRKTNQIEAGITRSPSLYRRQQSPKTDKQTRKRSPKPARRNNNNVLLKDVDGSRRFKWRGSVNKIVKKFGTGQPFMPGGTFGVHLEDCPQSLINEFVPFVVDLCCRLVETHGLFFTGIYRVPGNNASLTLLKDDLNLQGSDAYQGDSDERFRDVNVVSSLLKLFFRKLPDPLFTNELYSDFIQMNRNPEPELRLKGLRQLVHMLPAPHYETLKFLTLHLRKIADHSHENKMEVRNLAIVFGPTLVRSTADDNMTTMVKDMSDQCRIVESVIQHADWFFKEEAESDSSENILSPPLIPEQPTAHEPVPSIRYLLANVGRTPGDNNTSDNTSESSKSKNSIESEKDSFSKEVFEKLFGRKVKKEKHDDGVDSADEHGGFENRVTSQKSIETEQHSTPNFTLSEEPITNKSQETTHKPLYNEKDDISARLYEFYIEHLDKMAKTTIIPQFSSTESSPQVTPRLSKQFVYSIPDVAMVEKRHVRQKSDGNPYDYNHPFIANGSQHNVHGNQFKSTETLHRSNQTLNVNNNQSYAGAPLNQSTPVRDPPTYKPPPTVTEHRRGSATNPTIRNYNSNLSTYSHDLPLPSKTIRPNDSLETKLKYLTNLDGKHDTSVMLKDQQLYNEKLVDEPVPEQKPRQIQHRKNSHSTNHKISSASRIVAAMTSPILGRREHLKRSNPSITAAGELLDKHEPKKSAQKLYNERKIQREKIKQQKQAVKAEKKRALVRNENSAHAQLNIPIPNSVTISLTSPIDDSGSVTPEADRNVPAFNRKDPKRRVIARTHDENSHISHNRTQSDQNIPPSPKSPATSDKKQRSFRKKINKVVRRHTLGAGDFPDHTFWEENENENLPNKRLSLTDSADVIPPSHSSTSLCDLTSEKNNAYNQQLSAVDRLLPKVPTTHSTIRSWMLQERMKNRSGIFTKSQHEILVRPKSQKS